MSGAWLLTAASVLTWTLYARDAAYRVGRRPHAQAAVENALGGMMMVAISALVGIAQAELLAQPDRHQLAITTLAAARTIALVVGVWMVWQHRRRRPGGLAR